jgi:hypothetical protein
MAMKNKTLAIPADATDIPVNPKMPAMTAMRAKMMEYLIMPSHRATKPRRAYLLQPIEAAQVGAKNSFLGAWDFSHGRFESSLISANRKALHHGLHAFRDLCADVSFELLVQVPTHRFGARHKAGHAV